MSSNPYSPHHSDVLMRAAALERERLADLDHFDPHREQTDRYDRRDDEEGYGR